ncbi:hypothetical protein ACOCG7_06110 [Paraburkholderia sp. DD10]|jgi:hypothetical protein|uniref:hypothetical protein n=1 Tax=Paraburkholderia TaxID=1822464 RepID=UPI0032186E55
MDMCPLLRASAQVRKIADGRSAATAPTRAQSSANARYWLALAANFVGWLGWRALRDVLNAIPDSNDDFGLF